MAIAFEPLSIFDASAARDFARVGDVNFYAQEHASGHCALFAVKDGKQRVGSVLFCSETKPMSGEKVFAVVAASTFSKRSILKDGKELISEYARNTGHHTVKFYTTRPKLAEWFVKEGARAKITWSV